MHTVGKKDSNDKSSHYDTSCNNSEGCVRYNYSTTEVLVQALSLKIKNQ